MKTLKLNLNIPLFKIETYIFFSEIVLVAYYFFTHISSTSSSFK